MTKLFKPCLDPGTILLKAIPVIMYIVLLVIYQSKLPIYLLFTTSLTLLIPCVVVIYSFFKTNCVIAEEGYLFVQQGFAKKKVNITDIDSLLL
jgi:hypothetical protein